MKNRIFRTLTILMLIIMAFTMTACNNITCVFKNHTWTDANYQTPKTCTVCGKTEGDLLPADYATTNLTIHNIELGKKYEYTTSCYADMSQKTNAIVWFENYEIITSPNNYEPMNGYEWRIVDIKIHFPEENAYIYDVAPTAIYDCYYQMGKIETESTGDYYTVNYNGIDYTDCMYVKNTNWVYDKNDMTFEWTAAFRVPIGYDGTIIAIYDYANTYEGKTYYADALDENSLVFRLN